MYIEVMGCKQCNEIKHIKDVLYPCVLHSDVTILFQLIVGTYTRLLSFKACFKFVYLIPVAQILYVIIL